MIKANPPVPNLKPKRNLGRTLFKWVCLSILTVGGAALIVVTALIFHEIVVGALDGSR